MVDLEVARGLAARERRVCRCEWVWHAVRSRTSYVNQHTTVVPHPHSHARTKMGSDRRFTRGRHLSRISPPRPARPQTRLGKPERKTEPPSTKAQPLVFGSPLRPSCPICAQRPSSTATAEPPGYEEGAKLACYNLLSQTTLAHTFRARACRTRQLQLSRLRQPRRRHSEHRLARA